MASERRSIRVVHLTSAHPALDPRIFYKECVSMQRAGYEVHLVAQYASDVHIEGIMIHALPTYEGRLGRMILGAPLAFIKAIRLNPSVLHFHDVELLPLCLLWATLGRKVVFDIHEDVPQDLLNRDYLPPWLKKIVSSVIRVLIKIGARNFRGIVAATPTINEKLGAEAKKIATINNFPILAEFSECVDVPYGDRPYTVLYLGAISADRGIFEILEALELVSPNWGVRMRLAGLFSDIVEKKEAMELFGWNSVIELGQVDRASIPPLLNNSRIGLVLMHRLPNADMSQPTKLYEYMAGGLPVIASNIPLWKEIVDRHQCGIIVDPLNPHDIAEAVDWLFEHPEEAEAMGKRGRAAVINCYNWTNEELKLLNYYIDLCLD